MPGWLCACMQGVCMHMYVCMHSCVCICICTCLHMYMHGHARASTRSFTCWSEWCQEGKENDETQDRCTMQKNMNSYRERRSETESGREGGGETEMCLCDTNTVLSRYFLGEFISVGFPSFRGFELVDYFCKVQGFFAVSVGLYQDPVVFTEMWVWGSSRFEGWGLVDLLLLHPKLTTNSKTFRSLGFRV